MNHDTRFVVEILAIWLCLAVAICLTGVFKSASAPVVALTVWSLTALILLSWWKVPAINHWLTTIDLSWLIALHLTRFIGIYFIILCRTGELSCSFAKPAGIGDIAIAIGATFLLFSDPVRPGRRVLVLIWNALGLLDMILVVFNALRVGLSDWRGMEALRVLPLGLLPTFLVPLIIGSHLVIFRRLRTI